MSGCIVCGLYEGGYYLCREARNAQAGSAPAGRAAGLFLRRSPSCPHAARASPACPRPARARLNRARARLTRARAPIPGVQEKDKDLKLRKRRYSLYKKKERTAGARPAANDRATRRGPPRWTDPGRSGRGQQHPPARHNADDAVPAGSLGTGGHMSGFRPCGRFPGSRCRAHRRCLPCRRETRQPAPSFWPFLILLDSALPAAA